jgi:signal transduction histidine kinase
LNRITENFMLWTQLASLRPKGDMRELLASAEPIALDLVAGTGARERAAQVGRSADLVCDLEPAPSYVHRDFLRKIVVELVDNAFKFSAAGTLVRVATSCRGGRTLLTVTDRGDGMPDEHAQPPDENYVPTEQGVGLGLAIVRRVVTLAGGQLTVHTPATGGTTVVVSLPSSKTLDAGR